MADNNYREVKADMDDSDRSKPVASTLISAATKQQAFCTSDHHLGEDSSPHATGPLHTPSFASSPSAADVGSSEVSWKVHGK